MMSPTGPTRKLGNAKVPETGVSGDFRVCSR